MSNDELEKWLKENIWITSQANKDWFNRITAGLPDLGGLAGNNKDSNGEPIHWGAGAHCVMAFADALSIVRPKSVLEIGLNHGYGSALLLALGAPEVYSIDISTRQETVVASQILDERYPGRFQFECISSNELLKSGRTIPGLDFAYIDGGHLLEHVRVDIALCRQLGIKDMLFDDWYPEHGPGVQPAIKESGLKVRAIFGNIVLCSEPL